VLGVYLTEDRRRGWRLLVPEKRLPERQAPLACAFSPGSGTVRSRSTNSPIWSGAMVWAVNRQAPGKRRIEHRQPASHGPQRERQHRARVRVLSATVTNRRSGRCGGRRPATSLSTRPRRRSVTGELDVGTGSAVVVNGGASGSTRSCPGTRSAGAPCRSRATVGVGDTESTAPDVGRWSRRTSSS
jgi:hypothetical protein